MRARRAASAAGNRHLALQRELHDGLSRALIELGLATARLDDLVVRGLNLRARARLRQLLDLDLEVLERRVGLEGLAERLGTLWADRVDHETVNEGACMVSEAIDSKKGQAGSVLERSEGLVESESLEKSLSALGT